METTLLRLKKFIDFKGISVRVFEQTVGMSNGSFASQLKNNKTIGVDKLENILQVYPELSPKWLLTGEGNMLKTDADKHISVHNGKSLLLYDTVAAAGYASFDTMLSHEKVVGEFVIPTFTAADWMIYVRGSSMYPKYSSGDIIACKEIKESKFIQWNKVYVIATHEQGLLVKRLMPSDKDDCILAVSDNSNYPAFNIPINEICGIALVLGVVRLE